MYNRYIPQTDGSYRKSRIQENQQVSSKVPPNPVQTAVKPPELPPLSPPVKPSAVRSCNPPRGDNRVDSFLRHLLPKDFDTGDLLVVLLLLLMAGDCKEEQNTALLTLGLYLFL